MRYPASEKLEIIRLVEQSHLPVKQTLDKLGIPRRTFYRWYDKYLAGGIEPLEDQAPKPKSVWNRIPDNIRDKIIDLALEEPQLSPRELSSHPEKWRCGSLIHAVILHLKLRFTAFLKPMT